MWGSAPERYCVRRVGRPAYIEHRHTEHRNPSKADTVFPPVYKHRQILNFEQRADSPLSVSHFLSCDAAP